MNGRDGHPIFQVEISGKNGGIVLNDYDTQLWKRNKGTTFRELLRHQFPQELYYTAPMVYLLEDLVTAVETERDPISSGGTECHALAQILATHYSSQRDSAKVRFPFAELEMTPPYKWFGEGGKVVNMAQNEGAKD